RLDQLVDAFYSRLFSANPQVRAMFPADMSRQKDHLAAALAILLRNLDTLDALDNSLQLLGAQHKALGVTPAHYNAFTEAMLFALRQTAHPPWSTQLESAWRATITRIASAMQRPGSQAPPGEGSARFAS